MISGLAERLKELRMENNLTQKQVADILKISPSIISG
ncbi:MAG: helix-turn-helix domain-containing protein, partial [Lachnospiraceae bacterium]|nr:helix-turn-helix domain-containing protein [Lachnospiraceae bacterium]